MGETIKKETLIQNDEQSFKKEIVTKIVNQTIQIIANNQLTIAESHQLINDAIQQIKTQINQQILQFSR